jgi:hypothetical protein
VTAAFPRPPASTSTTPRPAIPLPRTGGERVIRSTPAVRYEELAHQAVRREFFALCELTAWVDPANRARAKQLTGHAELVSRLVLQHHAIERDHLWPALIRQLPAPAQRLADRRVADWTSRATPIDHELRDLGTAGRRWTVAANQPARVAFHRALTEVADTHGTHTFREEVDLLPLLGTYLPAAEWARICAATHTCFSGPEQLHVLGLLLEDATTEDKRRLEQALTPTFRASWRLIGRRRYRTAVVRLRGAPPAL